MESEKRVSPEAEQRIVQMVYDHLREAESGVSYAPDGKRTLREIWEIQGRRALGDHWDTPEQEGLYQFTLNRTGNAVITQTAIQFEEPPHPRFQAVESAEPPVYFVTEEGKERARAIVESRGLARPTDKIEWGAPGSVRVPEHIGKVLKILTKPQVDPQGGGVLPAMLEDDDLVIMNDSAAAKALQTLFDKHYELANGPIKWLENFYNTNVFGHQPMLVQWDHGRKRFKLLNPNVLAVRLDPNQSMIDDSDYAILELWISLEKAMLTYPKFKADLKKAAEEGKLSLASNEQSRTTNTGWKEGGRFIDRPLNGSMGENYPSDIDFQRKMVRIVTLWRRHVMFPMTEDEARLAGKITLGERTANLTDGGPEWDGPTHQMEDGSTWTGEIHDDRSVALQSVTVPAWYLVDDDGNTTDQVVRPDDKDWPKVEGIEQIQMLAGADRVISVGRCPYIDIPLAVNKNIPIMYSPYGLGEPYRCEDPQQILNRLASIIINYFYYYQYPQEYWPQKLLEYMDSNGFATHGHAGRVIGIPDSEYERWFVEGKRGSFAVEVPPLPENVLAVLQLFLAEHDRLSNSTAITQGRPEGGVTAASGLNLLSKEARGAAGFKAKFGRAAMMRAARIMADAIIKFMPPKDIARVLSIVDESQADALIARLKNFEYDITIEMAADTAVTREVKRAEARQNYKDQLIDQRTALEQLGVDDPDQVIARIRETMPAAAPVAADGNTAANAAPSVTSVQPM